MSTVATPGEPRTIVTPGNGTGTLSVELPPGVTLDLEAVLANIDATGAGGPVLATLAVSEQSGVVIATKRQGETVDAGILGSATWALRLDDEQVAAGGTIKIDKGATVIDPAIELRIGALLSLVNLGGGRALLNGLAPPTPAPVLLSLLTGTSQASGIAPLNNFAAQRVVNDNANVGQAGGLAFYQFSGTVTQRMEAAGTIYNNLGAPIDATLTMFGSIFPAVVGLPVAVAVLNVPSGVTQFSLYLTQELMPAALSACWLDFNAVFSGGGGPAAGVGFIGSVSFRRH